MMGEEAVIVQTEPVWVTLQRLSQEIANEPGMVNLELHLASVAVEKMEQELADLRARLAAAEDVDVKGMRETFAAVAHNAWCGWMKYLFSKCEEGEYGSAIIPAWAVHRWQRQAATVYADLPEEEKPSDREEADKYIAAALPLLDALTIARNGQALAERRLAALEYRWSALSAGLDEIGWSDVGVEVERLGLSLEETADALRHIVFEGGTWTTYFDPSQRDANDDNDNGAVDDADAIIAAKAAQEPETDSGTGEVHCIACDHIDNETLACGRKPGETCPAGNAQEGGSE